MLLRPASHEVYRPYFHTIGPDGQKVSCGDIVGVQVGTNNMDGVGICQITRQSDAMFVEGFIPGSNGVTLKAPVEHVRDSDSSTVFKAEKASLDKARETQFGLAMKISASCPTYRRELRKQQTGCFLRTEVKRALRSKAATTHVSFGLCFCETDLEVFGINPFHKRTSIYSYKAGNLSNLDILLGKGWDIHVRDDQVSFVTQVKVSLSKEWVLKASISTAVSWGPLPVNYRAELQNTLLNANF
ncbi:hypothetical protein HOLleu_03219 [Holothuria leucospilota]|uniref:Uncharacterized protein n=1 Tax=Holothuria leucospilota TaxID=206669 RepID=A0A9Q1CSK5_HOLLE|nr:hypothetical protein HOLleu_03219 [Holothuria leucospilota]